ncbi:MAG TPA: DUF87 domain-containing protein [Alphaproteobacteria bacterium]
MDTAIGRITGVAGDRLTARALRKGEISYGELVKVAAPRGNVFGFVSRLWSISSAEDFDIDILGEIAHSGHRFERGVSAYPALDAEVRLATAQDFAAIYARPNVPSVRIGALSQAPERGVHVMVDALLGKHFAVLGTTGAGKSCATALILKAVLDACPHGHVVILDPHNEYSRAFGSRAEVFNTANLRLPYWLLNFEEAAATFCSDDPVTREYEVAILKDAILAARLGYARARGGQRADVGYVRVDTPSPYFLDDVVDALEKGAGKLEKPGGALPYMRLLAKIDAFRRDERFAFMFPPEPVDDTIVDIISRLVRVPTDGRPMTIVDLSGAPAEIVDVLVSVLCRLIFDFALWSAETHATPILLVCEEAHRYVPRDAHLGFGPTRRAIARIAMEGRKYGVSLCLISNRPSELSPTMLAQCNTLFALRLSNQQDHDFVRSALPDGMAGLVGALPALRAQEAIVFGDGVSVPMRVRFDTLGEADRPRSATAPFASAWQRTDVGRDYVRATVARWRHHRADPPAPAATSTAAPRPNDAAGIRITPLPARRHSQPGENPPAR